MRHFKPIPFRASNLLKILVVTVLVVYHNALSEDYECTFDQGTCNFFSSSDNPWIRYSGPSPSSSSGPSSDHTTGAGYYMFVNSSFPNIPSKGPFELETTSDNLHASSVFFWYNMYGQSMGSLALQAYSNASGWVEQWNRTGNQGEDWQMAAINFSCMVASKVKFVACTGSDCAGDIAVDDVHITRITMPAPTTTASTSTTPWNLSGASLESARVLTTVFASTASQIQSALQASGNSISLSSDITLSRALNVSKVTAVRVIGNDFEVSGNYYTSCFIIIDAEIWISNLIITKGYAFTYGGGLYITGYSQVTLSNCIFSQNVAYALSGGAVYAHGRSSSTNTSTAENGKFISIVLQNCTMTGNSAFFGGAIVFNFQARHTYRE